MSTIKYTLLPNALADNAYAASMRLGDPVDLDGVIELMDERGTTVAESEARAVLIEFLRVIKRQLLAGKRVNIDGLVRLFPSIRGSFTGPDDDYDASRHLLVLNAVPDRSLQADFRKDGAIEKVAGYELNPILQRLYDHATGAADNVITPGSTATIVGQRLKFNPDQEDEGLFLINTVDNTETKVAQVPHNLPKELLFLVPADLPTGASYKVELRKRFTENGELRSRHLSAILEAELAPAA